MADLDLVRRLVEGDHGLAVAATTRADGSVHASVVNAGVLAHPVHGRPVVGFVVQGDARKLALLRRAGRAAVTFRVGWEWASVEGPVDLAGPADPLEGFAPAEIPALLRAVFTAAGGTHGDWDEYDRVMARERRTAVLVEPARIRGNAAG
jgi:PPOX class probable F420-dependent enzyme